MRGAKCDAADCGEFESGGSAGALSINMGALSPTKRRSLAITLYQANVLDLSDAEYMEMVKGESMPKMGRVHVDLCEGHLLTALSEYGILDMPEGKGEIPIEGDEDNI